MTKIVNSQVLLITSDSSIQTSITDLFNRLSIDTKISESVIETVHYLKQNTLPDLLILDLTLQDNRAMTLLSRLREKTNFDNLPVLVLTEFPDPIQIREALQAGANRYLTKMFVGSNLLNIVEDMLRQT
ncbi:MAG: hypothetical protein Phog2KO_50070 [Phototrophicaceae bacterium]